MAMEVLILEVADYKDAQHWRWVLKDRQGKFLQDFKVDLDSNDHNYLAFLDLYDFLKVNSSPDRWIEDQAKLIHQLGSWISQKALGLVGERIAKFCIPITIRLMIPPEASGLLYLPWEIALIGDKPLAMRNVSLVSETTGEKNAINPVPIGDRLRILAVFSLPTDASALALRRERYELMRLISQLAQAHGLAIEMRVLQYGTTRQSLQEALEEGEGWDLIHFSGHGDIDTLILENPDGSHDPVTSEELGDLLSLASGRLKLVILSACLSAAATIQETLAWLKIKPIEQAIEVQTCATTREAPISALAVELVTKLDCAALAMRYPIGDEFAINLTTEFYRLLIEKGNSLTRSLQLAMQKSLKGGYNTATPPISLATPTLFGSRAVEMILKPPKAPEGKFETSMVGLAYYPPEPKRFVGRTGPLGRASSALAKESNCRGVLFYGMAGAGKTACALEMAYHQRRSPRFRGFVWHEAPKGGSDIEGALIKFALDMEIQLPGFKMAHLVDRVDEFRAWLPILSEMLEQNSILIVLDNLDNLLTSDGYWKDERWGWLLNAMLDHEGLSRIILTSRRLPKDLAQNNRLLIEIVNALSLNEAALLAREMPNLSKLMIGKSPLGLEKGREIVKRTLSLIQGHPKLIELADAQASDSDTLGNYLEKVAQAWGDESRLEKFFEEGISSQVAEKFLEILKGWTQSISENLPKTARVLFHFICALEDSDRSSDIVESLWPELWRSLDLPGHVPKIRDIEIYLKPLLEVQPLRDGHRYIMHPSVGEAGLAELDEGFRPIVDSLMGKFWLSVFFFYLKKETIGGGGGLITSGIRAAPYLVRTGSMEELSTLIEASINRDRSPDTLAEIIYMLHHVSEVSRGTDSGLKLAGLLSKALFFAGRWNEAEIKIRSLIPEYEKQGKYVWSLSAAGCLFSILRDTGRLTEALELLKDINKFTLQAGMGPWTQLGNEIRRLQILNMQGKYNEVLQSVKDLRIQVELMPEIIESVKKKGFRDESVDSWNIKEALLNAGFYAAIRSKNYQMASELNAASFKFKKDRGANQLTLARVQFNNYGPLLELGQYDEAEALLLNCKAIFEEEKDIGSLGPVFTALAELKHRLCRNDQSIRFIKIGLRYQYLVGNTENISLCHSSLADYLGEDDLDDALAHHLAAGIIRYWTNSGLLPLTLQKLSFDLAQFAPKTLPNDFDQLCIIVEKVEGVRFRELFHRLVGPKTDGDHVMGIVIKMAKGGKI
jgi:hypothetical protein